MRIFETEIAGRPFSVEIGEVAQLAKGSAMIRYGETSVLAIAAASKKPREGMDFFPLSVDYEEKQYAVGKIPGGFLKREGRPSEKAILNSACLHFRNHKQLSFKSGTSARFHIKATKNVLFRFVPSFVIR